MAKRRRRRKKGKMKALIAVEAAVMLALIVVLFVIWKLDLADTGNKRLGEQTRTYGYKVPDRTR